MRLSNTCPSWLAAVAALAALLLGCASASDVRSVGGAGAPVVVELRGSSLAELETQAARLCPNGHQVIGQWQRQQASDAAAPNLAQRAWIKLSQWTGELPADEAQMTVQCDS